MRNYLESLKDFGSVNIERSKDCSGYKWGIKWINGGDKAQLKIVIIYQINNQISKYNWF